MDTKYNWKEKREKRAFLALTDGTVYRGHSVGAAKDSLGEVVFNTGMTGYQEILSDPSYNGQIVTMTYTEMGNYGITMQDMESRACFANGFIARREIEQHVRAGKRRMAARLDRRPKVFADFNTDRGLVPTKQQIGAEGDCRAMNFDLRRVEVRCMSKMSPLIKLAIGGQKCLWNDPPNLSAGNKHGAIHQ